MSDSASFPETPKEPGSRKALEWRQRERLALRLNAPVKGPRGLQKLVALRTQKNPPHALMCKCPLCFDPTMPTLEQSRRNNERR